VLVEDAGALPVGKAKLTVTAANAWSATLNLRGQPTRTARGTSSASPVLAVFPAIPHANPALALPETRLSFAIAPASGTGASDLVDGSVTSGSFAGATLRGFRLAKTGRSPVQRVTVAWENDAEGDRTTTPGGTGYATGTLAATGLLPLAAVLGDGQRATLALNLSQTHQAVAFAQPYADKAASFFGGIVTVGDLGAPERGGPTESQPAGLRWRKAAMAAATSYRDGFGLGTPLGVTARVDRWVPQPTAEGLALALGLDRRELAVSYTAPPAGVLPELLGLRPRFGLVRLSPATSVPWAGSANGIVGTFAGTLTLPAPATRTTANGVFLQRAGTDPDLVGLGLVKIPVTGPGLPPGSFQTAGLRLDR
jgi:hypothetical protein